MDNDVREGCALLMQAWNELIWHTMLSNMKIIKAFRVILKRVVRAVSEEGELIGLVEIEEDF